ncbi:MAG: hypothetical protein JOZ63_01540 [Planctomycetaceae bacterium]|nr:hypothetical protein [Planctomycetaceae bacterium]
MPRTCPARAAACRGAPGGPASPRPRRRPRSGRGVLGRSAARGPAPASGGRGAVAASRRPRLAGLVLGDPRLPPGARGSLPGGLSSFLSSSLELVAVGAGGAAGAGGWRPPELAPAWAGAGAGGVAVAARVAAAAW